MTAAWTPSILHFTFAKGEGSLLQQNIEYRIIPFD